MCDLENSFDSEVREANRNLWVIHMKWRNAIVEIKKSSTETFYTVEIMKINGEINRESYIAMKTKISPK